MSCEDYRELLPAYLDDSLDEVRRTGFRAHLRSCAECRAFAITEEPTLVFSLARRSEPSPEKIEACVNSVLTGVRQEQLQQRLRPARRPWLAAAAAIVVAIIASSLWWMSTGQPADVAPLQADALKIEDVLADGGDSALGADETAPELTEPPPRVEVDMVQEEVRVYQYAIGEDATTGAVFIVNPAMEL